MQARGLTTFRRDPERATNGRPGAVLPALVALCVTLVWLASRRDFGLEGASVPGLGAMVVLLCCLPWLLPAHAQARWAVPFLPVLTSIYALFYGWPVLFAEQRELHGHRLDVGALERALGLALDGLLGLYVGFWILARFVPGGRPIRVTWDVARARRAAWVLFVFGLCVWFVRRAVPIPASVGQIFRLLERMMQLGIGMGVVLALRGQLSRSASTLLWAAGVPLYLFLQIGIGSVAHFALAGIYLMFIVHAAGRRVPVSGILLLGCLALILRGNAEEFRKRTWWNDDARHMSSIERSAAFVDLLAERFDEDGLEVVTDSAEMVRNRSGHLWTFAHVIALTPGVVPFWGGHTLATLPSSFVPRFLWPDKPSKRVGQEFGHRYELLHAEDFTTAANLPQLIELYANFGRAGVVLGMALFGVLVRLLYRTLNDRRAGDGTMLVAAIVFSTLLNIESDFSLVLGGLLQMSVILVLVVRWAAPKPSEVVGEGA